jgi:pimeloyl-ACP methyl ester carboxylesterase
VKNLIKNINARALFCSIFLATACRDASVSDDEDTAAAESFQEGISEITGGHLFYEAAGTGDPVVLIHGNEGDRRHWDHQFGALAQHFQVIRYDARGFGKSSLPTEGEPYSDHDDLAALLDHLNIDRANIIGWSMGSGIAVDFVLAYPERAKSLASVGPWVFGYTSPAAQSFFDDFARVAAEVAENGTEVAVDAWMRAPFFAATIRDPSAAAEFRKIAGDHSWWAMTHTSPQVTLQPSALERLADIRVPTLILTAEYDVPACLEVADLLGSSVQNSRKIVMPDTGHLLHMEKPEAFNKHVIDFLLPISEQ